MNSAPPLAAPVVRPRACSMQAVTCYAVVDQEAAARRREAFEARKLSALASLSLADLIDDMPRDRSSLSVGYRKALHARMVAANVALDDWGTDDEEFWQGEAKVLRERTGAPVVYLRDRRRGECSLLLTSSGEIWGWSWAGEGAMIRAETL